MSNEAAADRKGKVFALQGSTYEIPVKVVLLKHKCHNIRHTLDVPLECKNVVSLIQTASKVNGKVTVIDASKGMYELSLEDVSLKCHQLVHVLASNDLKYQYVLHVHPFTQLPIEIGDDGAFLNIVFFGDVILCVNGHDIPAHKMLLSNKSPVFKAMFYQGQEFESSRIEIANVDCDTMLELLHFIYKGKFTSDVNSHLFVKYAKLLLADRIYFVEKMKVMCESKLSLNLTKDIIFDYIMLADFCNAFYLKEKAIAFFVEHAEEIIKLPSYKDLLTLHPNTLSEIVRALVLKKAV